MNRKTAVIFSGKSTTAMPGGLGAYAHNICRIFNELGYDVHLFGYGKSNSTFQLPYATAYTIRVRSGSLSSLAAPIINFQLARAAQKLLEHADVAQTIILGAGIWAEAGNTLKKSLENHPGSRRVIGAYFTTFMHEYRGQIAGAPVKDYGVFSNLMVRLSYLAAFFLSIYEHRTLRKLDSILIHYKSSHTILSSECKNLDLAKITTTPYYADLYIRQGYRTQTTAHPDSLLVAIICRQDPRKGINTFLHAVAHLKPEKLSYKIVIAGSGIFLNRNIRLSKKLGVDHLVHFAGFIPSAEALILKSDIMILPSFEEGSGAISLLEAMKIGRPIISSSCDGIPEDLRHEYSALLFEPGNVVELAHHIRRLVLDSKLRNQLAANSRLSYNEKFSPQKMSSSIHQLLEQHQS